MTNSGSNNQLLVRLKEMKEDIETRLETDTALRMTGIHSHSDYNLSEGQRNALRMKLLEIEDHIDAVMNEPQEFDSDDY